MRGPIFPSEISVLARTFSPRDEVRRAPIHLRKHCFPYQRETITTNQWFTRVVVGDSYAHVVYILVAVVYILVNLANAAVSTVTGAGTRAPFYRGNAAMKQRITVSLPDNVHAWLKEEAAERGLQPGTHAAQLLYDIMQGSRPPAQHAQPRTQQAQAPQDDTPEEEPVLVPCPYLTAVWFDDGGEQEVWDAVAAQREGLTRPQFARKYGRNMDTGKLLPR